MSGSVQIRIDYKNHQLVSDGTFFWVAGQTHRFLSEESARACVDLGIDSAIERVVEDVAFDGNEHPAITAATDTATELRIIREATSRMAQELSGYANAPAPEPLEVKGLIDRLKRWCDTAAVREQRLLDQAEQLRIRYCLQSPEVDPS